MTQDYNAFGESWYRSWGNSWGRTTVADALEKSGVTRLWMYDLYEQAIQDDLKKKQEFAAPVVAAPVVAAPVVATTKPKQRRVRRAVAKLEPKRTHKPIPHYAPAFVKPVSYPDVIKYLAELSPLPVLKECIKETVVAKARKIKRKRKQEEELLLLLAA